MNSVRKGLGTILGTVVLAVYASSCTTQQTAPAAPAAASAGGSQVLQEATAAALGNMAWESVKVSEVAREGTLVKWVATTVTGKWRCQAQPDGKKPYCER